MLDELVARVSSPEALLGLSQTQLDGLLLSCMAGRANSADPIASKFVYEDEIVGLYPVGVGTTYQQKTAVDNALMKSWQRFQSGGLIMQAPGQAPRMMTLSAKGRVAAHGVKFEEITARPMLRREMLHTELQGAVYENFASGNDTAVRDAFVQVEIAVREEAMLAATLVGAKFMRGGLQSEHWQADRYAAARIGVRADRRSVRRRDRDVQKPTIAPESRNYGSGCASDPPCPISTGRRSRRPP